MDRELYGERCFWGLWNCKGVRGVLRVQMDGLVGVHEVGSFEDR